MELKGKTREGELVALLSGKDSYTIEVVASEDEKIRRSLTRRKSQCGLGITRMNLLRVRLKCTK